MTDSMILPCPRCDRLNRVPLDKLAGGGKCGVCKAPLFDGHPIALTAARFDAHANAPLPLLVDFWAAWCGPCRAMAPAFEAAAREMEPRLRFAKVDTEAEPALAARFRIQSIPTLVLLRAGREVARVSGALPAGELRRWVGEYV